MSNDHGISGPTRVDSNGPAMVEPMKKAIDAALASLREDGVQDPEVILICNSYDKPTSGKRLTMLTTFASERVALRALGEMTTNLSRILRGQPVHGDDGQRLMPLGWSDA